MKIRKEISRGFLRRMERHTPRLFYRVQLQLLADLAAESFGCSRIRLRKGSPAQMLKEYARFTELCMETESVDPGRLFSDAARLGARIRRISGLTERDDLQRLVFLLYRNIGITMSGEIPGEITVSGCYFSRFYTPRQCALMSCVDSGVISGIFGGGELTFSRRITEGCDCCIACFCRKETDHTGGN